GQAARFASFGGQAHLPLFRSAARHDLQRTGRSLRELRWAGPPSAFSLGGTSRPPADRPLASRASVGRPTFRFFARWHVTTSSGQAARFASFGGPAHLPLSLAGTSRPPADRPLASRASGGRPPFPFPPLPAAETGGSYGGKVACPAPILSPLT